MDFINALYQGELNPHDNFSMNTDYKKADLRQTECYSRLETTLSKEQKKMLEELWDCKTDAEYEYGKQMFKSGFSMAIKLSVEVFCK